MRANPNVRNMARRLMGEFLSDLISERALKIEPLARACGMEKKIIYNILKGKGYTIDSLLSLLQVLNLHLEIKERALQDRYDIFDN